MLLRRGENKNNRDECQKQDKIYENKWAEFAKKEFWIAEKHHQQIELMDHLFDKREWLKS
jgi:hypothetical protein